MPSLVEIGLVVLEKKFFKFRLRTDGLIIQQSIRDSTGELNIK